MKDQNPSPPTGLPEDEGAIVPTGKGEILLYQTEDGRTRVECRFQDETIWLSQAMMAELYQKDVRTINEHLKDIYSEKELTPEATIRKFRIVRREGRRGVTRQTEHYNLDAILESEKESADHVIASLEFRPLVFHNLCKSAKSAARKIWSGGGK